MSNKNKPQVDFKSIKEYEKAQRAASLNEQKAESMSFDQWWANKNLGTKLPPHLKEILKADAKGRGLADSCEPDQWDWAAKQFGLSI